jgi:LiaI-LiaF-like transmembrane region/B-box zinc finger
MNCAIHTDQPATAYCRTCGKALCDNCKRDVRGVVYCEDCIAARVQGTFPAATANPHPSGTVPVAVTTGPNPALATILAIFFPFGVASVYLGQYAKGLVHLIIFGVLVAGTNQGGSAETVFGLGIAFFYVYQIIDAHRSAKALLAGEPAPDPFGLGSALGTENLSAKNIPIGAVILIAIGVLFLLQNIGMFHFHWVGKLWPLILIAIGLRIIMRGPRGRC